MSETFIDDLDEFVYAEELVRAVEIATGTRLKSKTAAKQHFLVFLGREPRSLEVHLKSLLEQLLADDLARWAKERLGAKLKKAQAVAALAAWYSKAGTLPPSDGARPPVESALVAVDKSVTPTPTPLGRSVASYFEGGRATTRDDYFKFDLPRNRGELRVEGRCPSCDLHQEFVEAVKRQVGTVVRVISGLFAEPTKTLADMFTSADSIKMACSRCRFGVSICGDCHQINVHDVTSCTWCGHAML